MEKRRHFDIRTPRRGRYEALTSLLVERLSTQIIRNMERKHIGKKELARRLGTQLHFSSQLIEPEGLRQMKLRTLLKIADALDVAVEVRLLSFGQAADDARWSDDTTGWLAEWEEEAYDFAPDDATPLHESDAKEYDARDERLRLTEEGEARLKERDPVARKERALKEHFAKTKK